ncbi:MAG: DUF6263 family protein, partial [Bacteroidia bacterium]|nr:DUF6263 family protein [Bacteroidia bacterium]
MNRKQFSSLLLMLFLVVTALAEAPAGPKALLRVNLSVGDKLSYHSMTDQLIVQDIMGMKQEMKQQIGLTYDMVVESKESGVYTLSYTYTRSQFMMDAGPMMGKVEYDSDTHEGEIEAMARGYAATVGKSFSVKMDERGQVLEITGVDEMISSMMEDFADLPEAEREAIKTSLQTQFGGEALKGSIQASSPVYPEKKVKAGSSWESAYRTESGFSLDITSSTAVTSLNGEEAVLTATLSQASDPETSMEMSGMKLVYDIKGGGETTSTVSLGNGMLSKSTTVQNLSGEVTASGGMMGNGMTWP